MERSRTWTFVTTAALMLLWGVARADVVQPEPASCPLGSQPSTCHGGPFCSPKTCTSSASCAAGTTCQDVSWCVAQVDCASGWSPTPSPRDNVLGACGASGSCAKGICKTIRVCATSRADAAHAADSAPAGSAPPRGCSCTLGSAAPSGPDDAWTVLALVLMLVFLLDARRRRHCG